MNVIEMALKTWYDKDNPLHLDPLHPAIKLAGEAGELLDLYAKDRFKPGFSWWKCKHCGFGDASHSEKRRECPESSLVYTPLVLDELGDLSYYLRVLAYIVTDGNVNAMDRIEYHQDYFETIEMLLTYINFRAASVALDYVTEKKVNLGHLQLIYAYMDRLLNLLDYDFERLYELNYRKLNSEPTAHGWKVEK